jgi:hypothetical protein
MRPGLALTFTVALVLVVALTVGCGSVPQLPTSPSLDTSAPPTTPTSPTTTESRASLVIEDAFAIGGQGQDTYVYEVRFLVRELGGRSGATIKLITVSNPNLRVGESTSRQDTGESCWQTELRVPPGGTLDTFYTDAGSAWLSYCWAGIDALPGVSSLPIEVFFKDDYGYEGSVRATITTFR